MSLKRICVRIEKLKCQKIPHCPKIPVMTLACNYEHFSKKKILFKSFVKIELSYVFTINMFSTAENCMEK